MEMNIYQRHRFDEETLHQYHDRLKLIANLCKEKMKGKLIWDSAKLGTYRKNASIK
jgi:hypothetical protein